MKRWSVIFKTLGNINRLKIVILLSKQKKLTVGEIAAELRVSIKSASKNLVLLHQLDVLESRGMNGHVYYELNPDMPRDINKAIKLVM
ncbi:MAG: hypothetical protein UW92_C0011G0007 [Candidatus Jorgensenbacteria bacterium GW2011_GWA2_45_13]|uniref:HTH arsR-type domain-containing protein n=1 Tax=Candidatus Jorgensenbacteria bacterium GW2011_GWA2_45_13 TaxID=1618662 RepID=A0A0G1L6M6_9BACT|nr:MAG: hypothetical protein UW92_C0011G0007 [Candidatus Jorgensenbacteria bacterium GW2011_GWA2_45_13]HBV33158.1 transcriptional regulator [Patescibacteria group bacterium]HCU47560.1 transcriptional regulator [Patescibacteria group bacterium]